LPWKGAAMPCSEALRVQAYFDGELDASAALDVEKHLETCAECASLLADLEETRRLVRGDATYHRAGDDLHERIVAAFDCEGGRATKPAHRFFARNRFYSGAASGATAMAFAAGLAFFLMLPNADPLVGDMMNAHLRSMMSDHLIDVASSDRHTVKPWFADHTDVSPPAVDFAKEGYPLIGGRADYVDGHRTAVVIYRHGKHVINIFAWIAGSERVPSTVSRNGYHLVFWQSGNIEFCAVSDTGLDELTTLTRLVQGAGAPIGRE
jgi:anti-sigma factor RsiW